MVFPLPIVPAFASISPQVEQDTGTSTGDTATFGSATVTGRGVIVLFALKGGRRVATLNDNKGNVYVRVGFAVDASDAVVEMWYCQPITGGASHTLTVTFDAAANCVWGAIEVSRVKGSSFLDAPSVATFTRAGVGSSASVSVTSNAPRGSNELFVAMLSLAGGGSDAGIDTPSGWTAVVQFQDYDGEMAGHGVHRVNPLGTALTATWTNDTTTAPAAAIIAAFRASNALSAGVSAPVNTVLPVITGDPTEDETLTASTGTWSNSPDAYTYQWESDGTPISGATASTYVLTASEIDEDITVVVTAHNEGGSASAESASVGPVEAGTPTGAPDEFDEVTVTPNAMISAYRRMRSGYSGSAYRVRRVSDNAEQDIGFDGDGLVDTAALTSFVGGSDGRIVTWYDQSGNGRDFGTAGLTLQPFVVTAGTLHTDINGLPTAFFNSGPYVRGTAGNTVISSTAYTYLAVARPTAAPNNSLPYQNNQLWQIQTRVGLAFKGTPVAQAHHYTSSHTSADVTSEAAPMNCVAGARFNGSNVEPFFNGSEGTPLAATSIGGYTDTNLIEIGTTFGGVYSGYMTEFAVWNTAISNDNINWAGASMAAVAGRTWTTVS